MAASYQQQPQQQQQQQQQHQQQYQYDSNQQQQFPQTQFQQQPPPQQTQQQQQPQVSQPPQFTQTNPKPPQSSDDKEDNLSRSSSLSSLSYEVSQHFNNNASTQRYAPTAATTLDLSASSNQTSWQQPEPAAPPGPLMFNPNAFASQQNVQPGAAAKHTGYNIHKRRQYPTQR
ncbi:uncharacterized protein LOC144355806 [Saccoglossus kowalevskii]